MRQGAAAGPCEKRGAAVDGELRLAVENDEHLLHVIVEVVADAALGLDDAAVQKHQVGVQGIAAQQLHEVHLPRPGVHVLQVAVLRGIGVRDALRQRFARGQRQDDEKRNERLHGFFSSMCMSKGPSV